MDNFKQFYKSACLKKSSRRKQTASKLAWAKKNINWHNICLFYAYKGIILFR